LSPSGSHRG